MKTSELKLSFFFGNYQRVILWYNVRNGHVQIADTKYLHFHLFFGPLKSGHVWILLILCDNKNIFAIER